MRNCRLAVRLAGFSLMEALVVLIVAGMALMLVFAIGGRAARTGFQLGRRALAVADGEVAGDEVRGLIRGLALPPATIDPRDVGLHPFVGDARGFQAEVVLDRAGLCALAGPAGLVQVTLEAQADGDLVTCRTNTGARTVVADLRPRRARFAYSADGAAWSDQWTSRPDWTVRRGYAAERRLFVRLASDDGRFELIERATSGPPQFYNPPVSTLPVSAPRP
jgi:hypothetical protein